MTNLLDAAVVLTALLIVGGSLAALAFANIPKENLPIFAALVSSLLTLVVGGYSGFRWGSSVTAKRMAGLGADQ
jgi:hypothetical protein